MTEVVTFVLLSELVDSEDKKPARGSNRDWLKRKQNKGYYNDIVKKFRVEDRFAFREIFIMDTTDCESVLTQVNYQIRSKAMRG